MTSKREQELSELRKQRQQDQRKARRDRAQLWRFLAIGTALIFALYIIVAIMSERC